jgi:DNA-binding MurR/RpiR family transcriptional regulator
MTLIQRLGFSSYPEYWVYIQHQLSQQRILKLPLKAKGTSKSFSRGG